MGKLFVLHKRLVLRYGFADINNGKNIVNKIDTNLMMIVSKYVKSAQMPTKSVPISPKPNNCPQFQCEFCGKQFVNSKQCRMHWYQVHSDKVYSCEICRATFKTKCILKNHLKTHNEPTCSGLLRLSGSYFMTLTLWPEPGANIKYGLSPPTHSPVNFS